MGVCFGNDKCQFSLQEGNCTDEKEKGVHTRLRRREKSIVFNEEKPSTSESHPFITMYKYISWVIYEPKLFK